MITPVFEIFYLIGSLFMHHHDLIDPLFLLKKIGLSLTHLIPEILGHKFGLIFYQNVLFNSFLSILYQFSPRFSIQLTTFFIDPTSF